MRERAGAAEAALAEAREDLARDEVIFGAKMAEMADLTQALVQAEDQAARAVEGAEAKWSGQVRWLAWRQAEDDDCCLPLSCQG